MRRRERRKMRRARDKEVGRSQRMKDCKDNRKKTNEETEAETKRTTLKNHTYRAEMKTNEEETRSEHERGCEGGDKLSLCSSSLDVSLVRFCASKESYEIVLPV